jgi:DNA polymerase III sliding clamp (beta) subunit (PCNA family)
MSERAVPLSYSGILIESGEGSVSATGSDGENSITSYAPATVEEPGSVLVLPKPLIEWFRTVDKDARVVLSSDDGEGDLVVEVENGPTYHFRTLSINFTKIAPLGGTPIKVDLSGLAGGLAAVRSSMDTNGVMQLISNDQDLYLNTTDTYRLSQAVLKGAGWGDFSGRVHLQVLERVAGDHITGVSIDQKGRMLEFSGPRARFSVGLSPVPYPFVEDYLAFVPPYHVTLPLGEFRTALTRLSSLGDDSSLKFSLEGGVLTLSISSTLGDGSEEINVVGEGSVSFAVSPEYMRAALSGRSGDEISLGWSSPKAALYLVSHVPLTITTLVMPVSL